MIIMINGAFGVGKTTVSNMLANEIKDSMIFDPEIIGQALRHMLPEKIKQQEAATGDFQDFKLWKELTVKSAKSIIDTYQINLIVPMMLRKQEYYTYLFNGFKEIDDQTFHFCLTAKQETIFQRLQKRGEEEGDWCFQQTAKCLQAYDEFDFSEYIDTDDRSIDFIVDTIMGRIQRLVS
ncbi:tunicamycin resistance protein [Jeotgalibacillus sp. S-D1]|uniref:ATP-binding protein n=1 Tax=Jeotgalibacillus sp. S-D1 TaxID=2552189 RepID=UPI00105A2200|nr:ATP-binding protein [Jeotgalibacillus sp. S-D1]TDL32707.1 tunicamycin resistance protein [Jeotgalibacillus sp. S-D1]